MADVHHPEGVAIRHEAVTPFLLLLLPLVLLVEPLHSRVTTVVA